MADRIEREIEEILAQLDELPEEGGKRVRTPVPIAPRLKRTPEPARVNQASRRALTELVNPAALMIAGAAVMMGGLLLASFAEPFIWLSFAGVVLFIGAFVISFFRTPRRGSQPKGMYWRDRYIEYESRDASAMERLKQRFRRR